MFLNSNHIISFIIIFVATVILGPIMIPILTKIKFGQTIRDDGPNTHLKKMGTPTIGGIIFLIPVAVYGFYYSTFNPKILPLVLVTLGFGLIGFIDDFIKVARKSKDGLYAKQKMLGLIVIATAFVYYIYRSDIGTEIIIPFLGTEATIDIGWFFIPFSILVLLATSNGVNITDGIDGLASGVTIIVMVFFTIVAMAYNEWEHVKIFSASLAGGCLGFLVFNMYPAKLFMGDTGSLALGGAIGAMAIMMRMPLILLIVGAVYVVETLSVIIQVGYFKLYKKRVFRMAPLHHHFELGGWKETKIVTIFWSFTVFLCIIGLISLRIKFH